MDGEVTAGDDQNPSVPAPPTERDVSSNHDFKAGSSGNESHKNFINTSNILNMNGSSGVASHADTPIPDEAAQSAPMTATTSQSSHQSAKDAAAAITHYGTRSRNRSSRPNYAEDVEMEFEPNSKLAPARDDASLAEAASQPPKRAAAAAASNGWNSVNQNSPAAAANSAPIPGTSSFSAVPSGSIASKKRKAASSGSAATSQTQVAPLHPSSRRAHAASAKSDASLSSMFSFEKSQGKLKNGKLIADDGTVFCANDHVYLVCEPPGDPYYMGRIMEFRTKDATPHSPITSLRINWVYRPRDVLRFTSDTRLVYATMHSDVCPLTSLRGKCVIKHRSEFDDLEKYRKEPDHFYFSQAHDRFIHRWYEVIPTKQVVNVPRNVKKALDERWKYIIVEASKVKELTSAVKSCKRCTDYCGSHNSVECAVCKNTYHMNCVRPPLLKKPSRGFAWACGPCSRAQEKKLEARRTPIMGTGTNTPDVEEEEPVEEEEEELPQTTGATPEATEDRPATDAEVAHAKLWTMRYLGIHCRLEDALQYDDRAIYPRASSRLGPKHQAVADDWFGRPVELVPRTVIEKKYVKAAGHKKDTKFAKETLVAMDKDRKEKAKRPKWVQDEPEGYVHRGEDHPNGDPKNTARTVFKLPIVGELSERGLDDKTSPEEALNAYMDRTKSVAKQIGIHYYSVDFLDRALALYYDHNFDANAAIKELGKTERVGKWPKNPDVPRQSLRDPRYTLTSDEKKAFEQGVSKYGSELGTITRLIGSKNLEHGDIVRYWYHWKKTPKGHEIWGSYGGRKHTKKAKQETEAQSRLLDDLADDFDDSAFDNEKIESKTRKMMCKHCSRRTSRIWRRAPGVAPGQVAVDTKTAAKKENLMLALCERCARLWRRYAIKWENQDELGKKVAAGGGRAWKKKVDEELLKEWELLSKEPAAEATPPAEPVNGTPAVVEPVKKKPKLDPAPVEPVKKKPAPPAPPPRQPTPPPAMPTMRDWPCAICDSYDEENDPLLVCRDCRLTVHHKCYGQPDIRVRQWSCDMCSNDRKEVAAAAGSTLVPSSYDYKCVLCPVRLTPRDLVEPPKVSHKKKNDKEREKERKEREFVNQLEEAYRQQQKEKGRPHLPREPLKRTADNNWVHVSCALFVPEIKFSNSKTLADAEGAPFALRTRANIGCDVCKSMDGATIECNTPTCHKKFHVTCAIQAGFLFGLDVNPVKSSRRDSVNIVTIGQDTGTVNAVIWCKEHALTVKNSVHSLSEKVDNNGMTAIQLYAQNFKQADITLTGTTRKAIQLDDFTKLAIATDSGLSRRASTGLVKARSSKDATAEQSEPPDVKERSCQNCGVSLSPRWFKVEHKEESPADVVMNGTDSRVNGTHLTNGVSCDGYLCHKCHIRKDLPPAEPQIMELDVEPPAIAKPTVRSPSPKPVVPPTWGPLSNIAVQAATHGTWPHSVGYAAPRSPSQPFMNRAPQPPPGQPPPGHAPPNYAPLPPHPHAHAHSPPAPSAMPAPSYHMHAQHPPPGQRISPLPMPLAPGPPHRHGGMSNGISMHSPTHSMTHMPFSTGTRPPPPLVTYGHNHTSPVLVHAHMRNQGMPIGQSQPPPPPPPSAYAPHHGAPSPMNGLGRSHASASANVRNILND